VKLKVLQVRNAPGHDLATGQLLVVPARPRV